MAAKRPNSRPEAFLDEAWQSYECPNLLSALYLQFWLMILNRLPMRYCDYEKCGTPFPSVEVITRFVAPHVGRTSEPFLKRVDTNLDTTEADSRRHPATFPMAKKSRIWLIYGR